MDEKMSSGNTINARKNLQFTSSCVERTGCSHIMAVEASNRKDIYSLRKYYKKNTEKLIQNNNNGQLSGPKKEGTL